jgi:DNA-directed RNA polymerase specialized sigma24 family protein
MSRRSRRAEKRFKARAEKRAAELRNCGPDETGNYGVNPYAARGHVVEVAPKELRSNPNSSQFPKRIVTQRVIDRYRARGHITHAEWQAANALWELWCHAGLEAKVTSGYEPVTINAQANQDAKIAKRLDAVTALTVLLGDAVPYRCRGVVKAVVIEDRSASDWAKVDRRRSGDSKTHGLTRLRAGLQALAASLGY